jgi:hypothetical protein
MARDGADFADTLIVV